MTTAGEPRLRGRVDRAGNRLLVAIYLALGIVVLVPVFSVRVPCLGDYLNHLARIHILGAVGHSAVLQRFYLDRWRIVPYFGMDVPVAALTPWFGLYGAGRIFVAMCVLTPPVAAATLRYAVWGRVGLLPIAAFLLCYNYLLALGFLNYLFSAGLAVMLLAGWIAASEWPPLRRAGVFVLPALVLYFGHVFAFLAYGILLGAYEMGRAIGRGRAGLNVTAAEVAAAGAQAVLPAVCAFVFRAADTFGTVHVTKYGTLQDRIAALMSPLYFPGGGDVLVGAFLVLPLLGLALARGRLSAALWPALCAIVVASCAAPAMLLNIWGVALRLPLVAAIVLVAAVRPPRLGPVARACVLGIVLLLVGARVWTATVLLRRLDAQVAQMRELVSHLPQGARLLVVDGPPSAPGRLAPLGIIQHMSLVAAIDRDAFVPMLFTGTTPVQLAPAMYDSASQAVGAITVAQLRQGYDRPAPPGPLPLYRDGAQMYWLGWPTKFDDVLITHFGADVGALPPDLAMVAANGIATLYRVAPP